MSFSTDNVVEMLMALNSFGPRFDPQSIPSYSDWLANHTFDPFGPEPISPISNTNPGIPFHSQPKRGLCMNVGNRVDRGHGSSGDMARIFPKERSRFAFAQERIELTADRWQVPIPTKATSTTVPRVVGPRPPRFQRESLARHEPPLAAPKAVYPLPTWLTRFEDYKDELLAEFCPPSEDSTPPISPTPVMAGPKLSSELVLEHPSLDMAPLFGCSDSGSGCAGDLVSGWYSEEDEDFEEEVEGCESFEFDTYSDSGSEPFVPAGDWTGTATSFDWPAPYQGPRVVDGEGYSRVGPVTPHEFLPEGSSSPAHSSTTSFAMYDFADDGASEAAADQHLAEMEEGLGYESWSSSGSPLQGEEEGWYDRFDLTGYTSPALPQQSWSLRVAAGLEPPPVMYPATIPLPDIEEGEDTELDAIVISPRGPVFDWWR